MLFLLTKRVASDAFSFLDNAVGSLYRFTSKSYCKNDELLLSAGTKAPLPIKTFEKLQNVASEQKHKHYTFKSSPEQSTALLSEVDAPLLSNNNSTELDLATSPQYIKIPLEDRSKYEKLVANNEVSSENSSNDESKNVKVGRTRKRRKMKNIPEKLHSVCKNVEIPRVKSFISERSKAIKDTTHKNELDVESDDSIGSASDLRVYEDIVENQLNKGDEISESIITCGSSAYHAECESMATHEEDCISRIIRIKQKEGLKGKETFAEDVLFVGHQYGEKPLLLDDELDSDPEAKETCVNWPKQEDKKEDLWIKPSSSFDDDHDVFAMAPFNKPKNKKKPNLDQAVAEYQMPSLSFSPNNDTEVYKNINTKSKSNTDIPDASNINPNYLNFGITSLNPFLSTDNAESAPPVSLSSFATFTVNTNIIKVETCAAPQQIHYCTEVHFPLNFPNETVTNDRVVYDSSTNLNELNKISHNYFNKNPESGIQMESHFTDDDFTKKDNFQNTPFQNSDRSESFTYIPRTSTPEIVYKSKKDKKKEKLKYQLIEERTTDDDLNVSSKTSKITKSSSAYKKVNNKSLKKSNSKNKAQGGFSNMSFEDFPSDEGEVVSVSTTPFEVLRSPEQEEKRYGSLKKIGNPFS